MDPFRLRRVTLCRHVRRTIMIQKIVTAGLVCATLAIAACNTVHGAAKDVNSVANCTQNAMNGRNC
jgi:predicted small secreted protein